VIEFDEYKKIRLFDRLKFAENWKLGPPIGPFLSQFGIYVARKTNQMLHMNGQL
jgi:hypothetical protein